MRKEPPLPKELWDRIPRETRAALWVVVDGYEQRIATLEGQVAALQAQLQQNSQNSSRPPSSDGPQVKRKPPRPPSGRKRGAQPGHPLYQRVLVPVEEVEAVIACKPTHCRRCGGALHGTDSQPYRHQVIEVPPPVPQVTEYQLHRLPCARCGITTCGTLPPGVPPGSYGPRLASLVGLCSGAYRMSKRMVASFCTEVLRVPMALGEICQVEQAVAAALEPPVQEARGYVQGQDANVDETSWRQQQRRARLWVVVTQWVSVFAIRASRGAKVLWELLGEEYGGVLTSDRAKAYNGQPLQSRQLCWAHLRRDFQAMIDRGGAGRHLGPCDVSTLYALAARGVSARAGSWGALCLPPDRCDLPRAAQSGAGFVDVRGRAGARPHEQRGGAGAAPCRAMAQDQLWDGQCGRESFCREYPDGGGDLSPARAECAGLSYPLLPGLVCRDAASLSATANNKLASNPTTVRSMNGYMSL